MGQVEIWTPEVHHVFCPWEQRDITEFRHLPGVVCKDGVPCSWSRNQGQEDPVDDHIEIR